MIGPMHADGAQARATTAFTHLEVHSHYTLLGATPSIDALVTRATADGLTHLALTDTNVLYGAVSFERVCLAAEIQPILGMTVTVAAPEEEGLTRPDTCGQLVLLARETSGYRSLCGLSSLIQGSPRREALAMRGLTWEELKEHSTGLICLSGGRLGWAGRYLEAGNTAAAGRYVSRLGGLYGENACLSIELHRPEDQVVADEIVALSARFGLPLVGVQPVYCLAPTEAPRLRLLAAIGRNSLVEHAPDELPGLVHGQAAYWLPPAEMKQRFNRYPQAMEQIETVVSRCHPALPRAGKQIWAPLWERLAADDKGWAAQKPETGLERLAREGLSARYGVEAPEAVAGRLKKELGAIAESGYAPLFLIVADVVRHARSRDIPVSTRGSVANSLVAYCTGITTVDPIAHDLLFERFINPARQNPPDIDLDFCSRRRDEVLAYVRETYGPEHVALVATISTMRPRSAVRETAKAFGLGEEAIGRLARLVPASWHPDPRRRSRDTVDDLLQSLEDERLRQVVAAAYEIVDAPHHLSVHPGGVVITPEPLTRAVPLQWAPKGFLITQFDHRDLEYLGLPKLDLLGIRALTVLADAVELVRKHHEADFRLEAISLEDELTGEMLARGETIGVFQCESSGAQRTLRQLQARSVFDLAVANAFFKPGPATGGMARTFVRRYRGEEPTDFLHPSLEAILAPTQGVLIFQEQILRVATEIAGLSWEEADHLRRGMSKFKAEEMGALQARFVEGCCRAEPEGPGFSAQQAETLWSQVLAFAGYGFNRGHATAYADVSYRSAYLKAHWPAAFLCARLADRGGFHHPAVYIAEAVRLGIPVRPPHVNHSDQTFTLTYDGGQAILWMGLGQVRELRRDSVAAIMAARRRQPFGGVNDLMERVSLQHREVLNLIRCGALDGLGPSRAEMEARADLAGQAGSARQMTFTFAEPQATADTPAQRLAWEVEILGQPVSVHPLAVTPPAGRYKPALADLPRSRGKPVTVAGVRLPGWTGGPGFFLGDGHDFVIVRTERSVKAPQPWRPLLVRGRWQSDEWGGQWFEAEGPPRLL
jgi:DNA polymerase III subunit alpha